VAQVYPAVHICVPFRSVADPDPDSYPDPQFLGLLDPDPLVRGMVPALNPDPSIIKQN
jgi:hypothetical protein